MRLRTRYVFGVTSSSSSAARKSSASSRLNRTGGVSRTAMSDVEERMLVICFSRQTLTARSSSRLDRKSTRLNSSHVEISYAVFCLKKKKKQTKSTKHTKY